MINVIDLNVLNFFYNLSNKQFYFLNQFMIFLTFLGDDGNIFILLSIILLFFKKTRERDIITKKNEKIEDEMVECPTCKTYVY